MFKLYEISLRRQTERTVEGDLLLYKGTHNIESLPVITDGITGWFNRNWKERTLRV